MSDRLIPPGGTIRERYWEWWLFHNPFKRKWWDGTHSTCPICESDAGCLGSCPGEEILKKLAEIKQLMDKHDARA